MQRHSPMLIVQPFVCVIFNDCIVLRPLVSFDHSRCEPQVTMFWKYSQGTSPYR